MEVSNAIKESPTPLENIASGITQTSQVHSLFNPVLFVSSEKSTPLNLICIFFNLRPLRPLPQ